MKHICDLCGFETDNGKVMSNHKRWKHRGVTFSEEAKKNLVSYRKKPRYKHVVKCDTCGNLFERITLKKTPPLKNFCCRSCSNTRIVTQATKEKISRTVVANLKKKGEQAISLVETARFCPVCGKTFHTKHKTCSKKCGGALRSQRTNKFSSKRCYRTACQFNFSLNKYPEEFNFDLVREKGWYKATNRGGNGTGVSRDHMVSVMYGWEHKIDPEIISHPANCQLLEHTENFKKGKDCSISLEDLMLRIEIWNKKYGANSDNGSTSVLQSDNPGSSPGSSIKRNCGHPFYAETHDV